MYCFRSTRMNTLMFCKKHGLAKTVYSYLKPWVAPTRKKKKKPKPPNKTPKTQTKPPKCRAVAMQRIPVNSPTSVQGAETISQDWKKAENKHRPKHQFQTYPPNLGQEGKNFKFSGNLLPVFYKSYLASSD